jgi:hypothetical protein
VRAENEEMKIKDIYKKRLDVCRKGGKAQHRVKE